MKLRRAVPAGLLDAGFASLATFAVGIYAARVLSAEELGVYAVFFSAFIFAAVVPAQLVLVPAQVEAAAHDRPDRLGLVPQTWRLGGPVALAAAVVASTAAFLSVRGDDTLLVPLAVSAAICTALSPLQDHVRSSLHLAGVSWRAAVVSGVQLAAVAGGLAVLTLAGVDVGWRPFGALAFANALSIAVGAGLSRTGAASSALPRLQLAALVRSGRWLLPVGLMPSLGGFVAAVVITHLAGAAAVGYAEAARIVAHPLLVISYGLIAVLGPRALEAGAQRDRQRGDAIARPYLLLLVTAGLLYGAVTATTWPGNLLAAFVPDAYAVPGLVVVAVVSNVLVGASAAYRNELMGAQRVRAIAAVAVVAGLLQVLVAFSAAVLGAYARPLGSAVVGIAFWVGLRRERRRLHSRAATVTTAAASSS